VAQVPRGVNSQDFFFRSISVSRGTLPHVAPRMYLELRICSFLTKKTDNGTPPGPRLGLLV